MFQAAYSSSILNVGFPSGTKQFCDVFLRRYPSTKCKHNYGDDNDDDDNNNKFIVVFVVIIIIIVIIVLSITVLQSTSYISEV